MATQMEAVDEMMTIVTTAWNAHADGAVLQYDNIESTRPQVPATFGRATVRHTAGQQITLGAVSLKRRYGSLNLQIFVPQGDGQYEVRVLSDNILMDIEDANPQIVRLTDIQFNEVGEDGTYFQMNIIARFSYDRVS
jgi:hypothetical protein